MLVNITKATYIEGFIIKITLNTIDNNSLNIITKNIDLHQYIQARKETGIFAPLKDIEYFKNFKLNANTIEWENGADIAPERFLEL